MTGGNGEVRGNGVGRGGGVSLDGVAARGLVNGRGPRQSRGRDEVGTRSDEPSQTYSTVTDALPSPILCDALS